MTYGEWIAAIRTVEDELSDGELERLASAVQVRMYGPGRVLGKDIPWLSRGQMVGEAMARFGCRTWEELELRLAAEGLP